MSEKLNKSSRYINLIKTGINEAKKGEYSKSRRIFEDCIKLDKLNFRAYINLSNIFVLEKNYNEAIELLKKHIVLKKYNIEILSHICKIYSKYYSNNHVIKYLKFLEQKDNKKNESRYYLYFLIASHFCKIDKNDLALEYYEKSLKINNTQEETYVVLLDLLERLNKIDRCEKIIIEFKRNIKVNNPKINYYESILLNRKKKYFKSEEIINKNKLEKLFLNDVNYYPKILNLVSKNNENLENYDVALESIKKRNLFLSQLKQNKYMYRENFFETFENFKKIYKKKNLEEIFFKHKKLKLVKLNIAFLVGFPRSGTTLLDTILRANSKTIVLEEKPYLLKTKEKFLSENNNNLKSIVNISENEILKLREYYLSQIKDFDYNKEKLIIDKLPLTITELGFVKILFPDSKIIVALRHPCDVVISCFFTYFKTNQAMINFINWDDTINFYDQVFELYEFYKSEFKFNYFEIKYEKLISEFSFEVKKLIKFLEIKYEENMEMFYKVAKQRNKISTPSYTQVINPLYQTSVGRWKNYKHLVNFENKLKKWIKKFNY